MAYDDTSWYGDLLVDEYDDKNNFMNPETPVGYYVYKIVGGALDKMQDMSSKFMNDFSILSADAGSLDYFWGLSYNMPRPTLPDSGRLLTDDEYRVYLYLRNCQLLTVQNILINMDKCFMDETTQKTCYMDTISINLEVTDHLHYTPITAEGSNIHKTLDDDTKHFITNFENDDDTETIRSRLSPKSTQQVVMIPFQNWDSEFLEFLEQFISIKGDLKIMEY